MKYKLEVLSPVHIGSGFNISPVEYVADDKFYRIDMDSLFKDEKFNIDDFIENAKFGSFYLGKFYGDIAKSHKRYVLEISNSAKKSLTDKKSEVREFIKTGNGVYIPGSSIKGALRTAILWYILKNDRELYSKMESYLESILYSSRKPPNKKYVDNEIEKFVFGKDPKYDLLKALSVSDTDTKSYSALRVENIRTLTTRRSGYGWKSFNILLEALSVGTNYELNIKKDDFFARDEISRELGFGSKINYLDKIKEICNSYAREFIEYEINFFGRYNDGNLGNVIEFYKRIKNEEGILLHISWGAGWHGMTVGKIIEGGLFQLLREKYRLGKSYIEEFPKTRKLTFEEEKPKYPMGWVRLEEIK